MFTEFVNSVLVTEDLNNTVQSTHFRSNSRTVNFVSNLGEPWVSALENSSNVRGNNCDVSSTTTSSSTDVVYTLHDVGNNHTETFLGVTTNECVVILESCLGLVEHARCAKSLTTTDSFTVHFSSHFSLENVNHFSHHFDTLHSLNIGSRFEREGSSELTALSNDGLTAEHEADFRHLAAYRRIVRTESRASDLPTFSRLSINTSTSIPFTSLVSGRTGITREARNCLPCGFNEFVRVICLINVTECECKTDRTSQRLNTNENVSEELREHTTDECERNRSENALSITTVRNTLVETKRSTYTLSEIFSEKFCTEILSLLVFEKTCGIITYKGVLDTSNGKSARCLGPSIYHSSL